MPLPRVPPGRIRPVRTVHVGTARLERWVAGFGSRHPGGTATGFADRVELTAPDGSSAVLHAVFGPLHGHSEPPLGGDSQLLTGSADPGALAAALVADAYSVPVLRVLLIRRGGYACAVLAGDAVRASKVGSRYVQGRTAAGGWSQQRFARRRANQAQALVGAVTEVAVRILLPAGPGDALVTGGDRGLLEDVLAAPRLRPLRTLRPGPHLDVGDPKHDLVRELPERARAIRIDLDEH